MDNKNTKSINKCSGHEGEKLDIQSGGSTWQIVKVFSSTRHRPHGDRSVFVSRLNGRRTATWRAVSVSFSIDHQAAAATTVAPADTARARGLLCCRPFTTQLLLPPIYTDSRMHCC